MYSSNICSANFHQLRDSFRSSCIRLLRSHGRFVAKNVADARKGHLRPYTTGIDSAHSKQRTSVSCNMINLFGEMVGSEAIKDMNKAEVCRPIGLQQNTSCNKILERPVAIIAFDIETTGFSQDKHNIIELAARDLLGGKYSTFESLVNPGKRVRNSWFHHISDDMVNRPDVPSFRDLIPIFMEFVRSRQMNGIPALLVAHNGLRFDVPFLAKEFERSSVKIPSDWFFCDSLSLARKVFKADGSKLASYSLQELVVHYNILLDGESHRAMHDTTSLCYVLQRLTFDLKLPVSELLQYSFRPPGYE